MVNKIVLLKI